MERQTSLGKFVVHKYRDTKIRRWNSEEMFKGKKIFYGAQSFHTHNNDIIQDTASVALLIKTKYVTA